MVKGPVTAKVTVTGTDPAATASIRAGPIIPTTRGGQTAAIRAIRAIRVIRASRQVSLLASRRSVAVAVAVAAGAGSAAYSPFGTQPFPRCSCLLRYPPR
jgi:hypothetical protein